MLERIGNCERGAGGDQQRNPGQQELAAVRTEEGEQALEGGQGAHAGGFGILAVGGAIGHCLCSCSAIFKV
jgi:hypothetical protein